MKWLFTGLALLLGLALAAAAGLGWLIGTESGLQWAAAKARAAGGGKLAYEGLRGTLAGGITFERLAWADDGLRVEARDGSFRAHLAALLGGRLTIEPLRIAELDVELKDGGEHPSSKPPVLPLQFHVGQAMVDKVELRRGDERHELREVKIDHARVGRTLALSGSLFRPDERFPARASVKLNGSLERFDAEVAGEVAGVAVEARAGVAPFQPQPLQALDLRTGAIDLARFVEGAPHTALVVAARAAPSPGGALAGTLSLDNAAAGPLDAGRLPVRRLDTGFVTDFSAATLRGLRAALPGGGAVQGEATLRLQDGHVQALLAASAVDLRALHTRLRQTKLFGPVQLVLDDKRQFARVRLAQEGLGLTAEVVRTGDTLEVRELRALAEGGEVTATGRIRLDAGNAFDARVAIKRFDPAALGDYPAGALSGSIVAAGRLEPRQIDLQWSLQDSTLYERSFHSAGRARVLGDRVTQADADVRLGANRLIARGAYGRPGDSLALALEAPKLEEFSPIAGSARAEGTLSGSLENPRATFSAEAERLQLPGGVELRRVTAKVNGSLAAHEAQITARAPALELDVQALLRGGWTGKSGWVGEIVSLRNAGAYALELSAPAALALAPERVQLGRLEARLGEGRILVRDAFWSPARLASSGEFKGLPAQWLIAAAGVGEHVGGSLLLDGEWQLEHAGRTSGTVRVRRAGGDLTLAGDTPIDLGLERASVELQFAEGRTVASANVSARVARLVAQGEVMPALSVEGKVEFAELGSLTGPFLEEARLDGRLSAELRATGTLAQPVLHGTLKGDALAFEMPPYGIALKDGVLRAELAGDRLKLESFSIRGLEGRFDASGELPLKPGGAARLDWRAEKLRLLARPDRRLTVSGQGEASYDGTRLALSGDLRADSGHIEFERERLPRLGEDVVILGPDNDVKRPAKKDLRLPLALDLRLDLGDQLVVRGQGLDGKLAGNVQITTTKEGELRAYGRLHTVHATFLAYGQRLDVDPGVLLFDGPIDNPSLQITAWRRNQAVEAGVQVTGTARAPQVQLVSQPPVAEGERLSWLVLGRGPSGATQADLGLLQAAAGALLAGDESVPLDRRIARRVGLDEVSLRGSGELNDRVVALGKRLSDRVYVSYEQGLGAVTTSLLKLDYALGRRWSLRAETGTSSGGGVFYRYSWD